ncbi:MAG: putative DNA binding domain-containing protein [Muribaculaceae bacterium]|nr:putative DNA binding domain-containing protein [Muribaculaceae bacterium]
MEQRLCVLLKQLVALPKENEWVEFKHNFHTEDEIGERISAIANSACIDNRAYGYLIFGVDDESHEILGTTFKPSQKKIGNNELENWLIQNLTPRIDFRIYEFKCDGKDISLFEIPAAENEPVDYKKVPYIRVGSITRKLSDFPSKERKIWNNIKYNFETYTAIDGCSSADIIRLLDTQSYFDMLGLPYPTNQDGVIERLIIDGLVIKKEGSYSITNLGGILFAKNLHDFKSLERKIVRVVQYSGNNKIKTILDEEFTQGYAVGFTSLVKFINDLLPRNEVIGDSLREEVRMYPQLAIRELVANSIIHQDFSVSGTATLIEIYNDRIEFSNPGKPLIDPIRFIDEYRSRNEKLASLMRRMKVCEEKGSGIDKVIFQCEFYQLPAPYFVSSDVHTKVILYAYKQLREMDRNDKIRAVYQHACLKWVSNDFMSNQSLRERFNIDDKNYSMASRLIKDALLAGVIKEVDTDNKSKKYKRYLPYWA